MKNINLITTYYSDKRNIWNIFYYDPWKVITWTSFSNTIFIKSSVVICNVKLFLLLMSKIFDASKKDYILLYVYRM